MTSLPDWWQRPGESHFDFIQRRSADYAAWQRRCDEARGPVTSGASVDLPLSVGTYDGNGNPKGRGWS